MSPSPPDDLADTLHEGILRLFAHGAVPLPPYPAVAQKVLAIVARKDFGLHELGNVIEADPTLAALVLRCANSALYARGGPVTSLPRAASRLGVQRLTSIVLSASLGAEAGRPGPLGALRRRLWIECLAGAIVCQELARARDLSPDDGYVVGLLHDFGKVLACACVERLIPQPGAAHVRPLAWWNGLVERDHVRLGLVLAQRWNLPPLLEEVIAKHHEPPRDHDGSLVPVVRAGDAVVAQLDGATRVPPQAFEGIGLPLLQGEREVFAAALEQLPPFVAGFEPSGPGAAPSFSLVAPEPAPVTNGAKLAPLAVTVRLGERSLAFRAAHIALDVLTVEGTEPLPEGGLVQVTLEAADAPLTIWARPRLRGAANGPRQELRPYALSADQQRRWERLTREPAAA